MRYEHALDTDAQTACDPPRQAQYMPCHRPRIECHEPRTHEAPMRCVPATTGLGAGTAPPLHQWAFPGFRSAHEVNEDGITGKRVRLVLSTAICQDGCVRRRCPRSVARTCRRAVWRTTSSAAPSGPRRRETRRSEMGRNVPVPSHLPAYGQRLPAGRLGLDPAVSALCSAHLYAAPRTRRVSHRSHRNLGELWFGANHAKTRPWRARAAGVSGECGRERRAHPQLGAYPDRRTTSSRRGPWTPSTRLSSMSLVADGPEMNVSGRVGAGSAASASGTVAITWSAATTHTW